MASKTLACLVLSCALLATTLAAPEPFKTFTRCELVNWLRSHGSNVPSTWTCLAYYESNYNSNAVGPPNPNGSRDHGIWQINDNFWCQVGGTGKDCNINCALLEDDDITDDYKCATQIENQQGFSAWSTWPKCTNAENDPSWTQGC